MCNKVDIIKKPMQARAYFRKDNLPDDLAYVFETLASPCVCGKKWFVRLPTSTVWEEAYPVDHDA